MAKFIEWIKGAKNWIKEAGNWTKGFFITIIVVVLIISTFKLFFPTLCFQQPTSLSEQISNTWKSEVSFLNKIKDSFGAVGSSIKGTFSWIVGYETGTALLCNFVYNLMIGILGGFIAIYIIVKSWEIFTTISSQESIETKKNRIVEKSYLIAIFYGFVFAAIMAIPVLNRIIGLITFYSILPNDWAGFLLRIILVGLLPGLIFIILSISDIIIKRYYETKRKIEDEKIKQAMQLQIEAIKLRQAEVKAAEEH